MRLAVLTCLISIKKTLQASQITRHYCFSVYMCEWARIMRLLIEFLISIFQVSEQEIVRRKFQLQLHRRSDFFSLSEVKRSEHVIVYINEHMK